MLFLSMNNFVESSDHQDHVLGRGCPWSVEENNMSMNTVVTVMMAQMLGENIIKCLKT